MATNGENQQGKARLPSIDSVLQSPAGRVMAKQFGHMASVNAIRNAVSAARNDSEKSTKLEDIVKAASRALELGDIACLKPVFNLTGTVLHTNLGRAQIAETAIQAAEDAMRNAVVLEFNVASGGRGDRDDILRDLICELTGAEDATVVNNNAAAVLLTLNTLSHGREAIVSRGELIEIGGAFRMPEIMNRAGAILVEVGTTNRTHMRDYETAISENSGLILKVHTSNYRIEGFKAEVTPRDLAPVAKAHNLPLVDDLGSGTLIDLTRFGLPPEPTVRQAVAAGSDIVTFSGDKLLGGPQAGFIVGRKDLIARINANPMKRALRVDKIRLAAIEATLRLYRDPDSLAQHLPTYEFLAKTVERIRADAESLVSDVAAVLGEDYTVCVVECASQVGSGSMPMDTLPSVALVIQPVLGGGKALEKLAEKLRQLPKPVIGRISKQALLLDLRCLASSEKFLSNLQGFANIEALE